MLFSRPNYFRINFGIQLKIDVMSQNLSLFEKVWDAHAVRQLSNGQTQLLIGTHLIHEVTSPQAFGMLRDLGLTVKYPKRTFATVDHIVPTETHVEPFADPLAQEMITAMVDQNLWESPGGKTPHATLYSAILRDLKRGDESRFVKTERGRFTVRA